MSEDPEVDKNINTKINDMMVEDNHVLRIESKINFRFVIRECLLRKCRNKRSYLQKKFSVVELYYFKGEF